MATGLKVLLAAWLLCATQMASAAELLPDPTRPAIDLNSSGIGEGENVVPDEEVTRGLQSVIISPEYRAAIINGETVRLGEKTGDSTLVEVRESSVVLQNTQGRRVLELFPKVNIKKIEVAPPQVRVQKNVSGQSNPPESAVGEIK